MTGSFRRSAHALLIAVTLALGALVAESSVPVVAVPTAVRGGAAPTAECVEDDLPAPPGWTQPEWQEWIEGFCLDEEQLHREVPEFVYRGDTRPPDVVMQNGFELRPLPPGWTNRDDDILRHIRRPDRVPGSGADPNNWVSTSSDPTTALQFTDGHLPNVYEIKVTDDLVSVPASWNRALREHPELWDYRALAGRAGVPETNVRNELFEAKSNVESEFEWAHRGPIEVKDIRRRLGVARDAFGDMQLDLRDGSPGTPDLEGSAEVANKDYDDGPAAKPDLQGEPVRSTEDAFVCRRLTPLGVGTAGPEADPACGRSTDDITEDDVVDADRFRGDVNGTDWELDLAEWSRNDSVLAPLPGTVDTVTKVDWAALDDEQAVQEHVDRVAESFSADLRSLQETTESDSVVERIATALGKDVDRASELLPYVAIAATGYALREDADDGRWGDAAADAILESLQVVGAVEPELEVFIEPAALVVQAIQMIADRVWSWFHPQPVPPPWNALQLEHALSAADAAPEALWTSWRAEHRSQYLEGNRAGLIGSNGAKEKGSLDRRFRLDIDVLSSLYLETWAHLERVRAVAERAGVPHDRAEQLVRQGREAGRKSVVDQAKHRMGQYVSAGVVAVEKAMEQDVASGHFAVTDERFLDEVARPYLRAVAENVWSVRYELAPTEWDRLDPWIRGAITTSTDDHVELTEGVLAHRAGLVQRERFPYSTADAVETGGRLSDALLEEYEALREWVGLGLGYGEIEPPPQYTAGSTEWSHEGDGYWKFEGIAPVRTLVSVGFVGSETQTRAGVDGRWSLEGSGQFHMLNVKFDVDGKRYSNYVTVDLCWDKPHPSGEWCEGRWIGGPPPRSEPEPTAYTSYWSEWDPSSGRYRLDGTATPGTELRFDGRQIRVGSSGRWTITGADPTILMLPLAWFVGGKRYTTYMSWAANDPVPLPKPGDWIGGPPPEPAR